MKKESMIDKTIIKKSTLHLSSENCEECPSRKENVLCSFDHAREVIDKIKIKSHFKKDQIIFHAGSRPVGIYSIQSGLIKLENNSESGHSHTLRLYGPGSILGYRALFANDVYNADAVALEDSEVCFIPQSDIMALLKSDPEILFKMLEHVSQDLKLAETKWVDQVDHSAQGRIAEAILFLNDHFHHAQWTRKEIAQWAGTTPETVMRTLSQFEEDGWVLSQGKQILIKNKISLQEKAKT